ncbi:MAG: hypothetical protein LBP28_07300, partial [Coriobacteriales bacterium]|nr:hypothetical protein [Coriobacteriales bacterium]
MQIRFGKSGRWWIEFSFHKLAKCATEAVAEVAAEPHTPLNDTDAEMSIGAFWQEHWLPTLEISAGSLYEYRRGMA